MGLTYTRIKTTGPAGAEEIELLVDTGSLYTRIPRTILERIGVKPLSRRRFRTNEGREVVREVGEALLELMGERATRIVVFGEEGDAVVLGADSLEGLGFEVDPATKQLRKTEAFIAY